MQDDPKITAILTAFSGQTCILELKLRDDAKAASPELPTINHQFLRWPM
jgi:hypothetical protein